ncbi:MAG: tartrate-resistant acid phosphatase type 5 family protein [Bacteroidota bacterium]
MRLTITMTSRACFVFLLIASFAVYGQKENKTVTIDKAFQPHPGALNFYLFGDWGRDGKAGQKKVSEVMDAAAKIEAPQFIVSTGDNFYPDGVQTATDKQWKTSFEDIYTGKGLQCPWYVVLGNHDYHGNPQAEIDYSSTSKRWNMPARYYVKSFPLGQQTSASIDMIFIDTSPLHDEYYNEKDRRQVISQDTTKQLRWIDSVLMASKATWKFVIGHHSMYTGGKRIEDIQFVRTHLEKIFIKNNVDFYLCGHEHDLQFIKPKGRTTYLVSGAGSEVRPTGNLPYTKFAAATNGFMALSVTNDTVFVDVLDVAGKVIYSSKVDRLQQN